MIPNRSDIQSKHEEKIEEYFICIHVKRNKTTLITTNHMAVRPRILDLRMYGTYTFRFNRSTTTELNSVFISRGILYTCARACVTSLLAENG